MTTTAADTDIAAVGEAEVQAFCAAVGELMLWASLIDTQLNKAILGVFALPEHTMIEPIVAQLDARPKAALLKKRARLLPRGAWRSAISNWVERAEKANTKRNVVAHHGMRIEDGRIVLHSDQLGKLMDNLDKVGDTVAPGERTGLPEVLTWIEQAKAAYEEGQTVLTNLDRFREVALAALRAAGRA